MGERLESLVSEHDMMADGYDRFRTGSGGANFMPDERPGDEAHADGAILQDDAEGQQEETISADGPKKTVEAHESTDQQWVRDRNLRTSKSPQRLARAATENRTQTSG